jgi:hypothetical protein
MEKLPNKRGQADSPLWCLCLLAQASPRSGLSLTTNVQPTAGGPGAKGNERGPCLLDVGWREIDERSAEQSPRLGPLVSRLRRPNVRLEQMAFRPPAQLRTLLGLGGQYFGCGQDHS